MSNRTVCPFMVSILLLAAACAPLHPQPSATRIPLHHFAVFYDTDLEIAPGLAVMQVNGLVHTNGDAYIQSGTGLHFLAPVRVAGAVHHGRKPHSGQKAFDGEVSFSNAGRLVSMQRPGDADGWLTSADADWTTASTARWGDGLADAAHGVRPLALPVANPRTIIERAYTTDTPTLLLQKFESKAGLKIIVQPDGQIASTSPMPHALAATAFFDERESKTVTALNIDIARLQAGLPPDFNGIVYVAHEQARTALNAVRLVNASRLPSSKAGGFTLATPNPVYVQGDFNTIDKQPAMIAADALTVLSNNWRDARGRTLNDRRATTTTLNCVCLQGTVPTANGHYSGGVENYFRLLENWTGVTFTFSGSIVNLWPSRQATGLWRQASIYYTAPVRNWSWDPALATSAPPGVPMLSEANDPL